MIPAKFNGSSYGSAGKWAEKSRCIGCRIEFDDFCYGDRGFSSCRERDIDNLVSITSSERSTEYHITDIFAAECIKIRSCDSISAWLICSQSKCSIQSCISGRSYLDHVPSSKRRCSVKRCTDSKGCHSACSCVASYIGRYYIPCISSIIQSRDSISSIGSSICMDFCSCDI